MATDLADPTPTGDTGHLIQPTRLTVKLSATRRWRWLVFAIRAMCIHRCAVYHPLTAKEGIEIACEARVRAEGTFRISV
jgi:hypothetical protein